MSCHVFDVLKQAGTPVNHVFRLYDSEQFVIIGYPGDDEKTKTSRHQYFIYTEPLYQVLIYRP